MASTSIPRDFAPRLASLLAGLRWRIRLYVWLEGLSLAVIWLGLMFWVGFALDYLPVLVGASEMPRAARAVLLVLVAGVLAYILYRWVLRRTFVRLADRSLALLLERRYGDFRDSLVTAVEMGHPPQEAPQTERELLGHTTDEALAHVAAVRYRQVFNWRPLLRNALVGALLVAAVAGLYGLNRSAVVRAAERMYLLADQPWPRSARIQVLGVELERPPAPGEIAPSMTFLPFENRVLKVAQGSNVSLKVQADRGPDTPVTPRTCTVYYHTDRSSDGGRGERGTLTLAKSRDLPGVRQFWSEGKPFRGLLSTLHFDVVGYDHRDAGYRIEVVDSPAVIETLVDLVYPPYLVDPATASYLPVEDTPYLPAGMFIPVGTQVTLQFRANKPLRSAILRDADTGEETSLDLSSRSGDAARFEHRVAALSANVTLEVSLIDQDNVRSDRPQRVFLTAVPDQPPTVETKLKGIGASVTPDVVIPYEGKVTDDYAVERAWLELRVGDAGDPLTLPAELGKGGAVDARVDFRELRSQDKAWELKPKEKLQLVLQGVDRYSLAGEPQLGRGDRYELEVVTPDELLSQLEVRELGLRRRFELIIEEMAQMRDSLLRVKASLSGSARPGSEPDDAADPGDKPLTPEQKAQRERELRLLRVQRAVVQSQKSVQETEGVAGGFEDIREELINNRVDTEDRKARLKDQIADPLRLICQTMFPELERQLAELEQKLDDAAARDALADGAVEQANETVAELEKVLQRMLDLETYNELLDLVRDLIRKQDELIDRTKQERKRQVLEDLQ